MKSLKDLSLFSKDGWKSFLSFREKRLNGFAVGIGELDKLIGGLSGIVGIQGEPGSCKSTFALQIATYNARKGVPVLIIDRENGSNRFKQRILSQLNEITQKEIYSCNEEKLKRYYMALKNMPLYVETSYAISLTQIKEYLSAIYDLHRRPMLMVVDSLQALPKSSDDERMALQAWIEGLDQLKLDFEGDLVILMTSEKSRGRYAIASKEAGKGTGSIEFKCEQLLDMRSFDGSNVIALRLVKNRDGVCSGDFYLSKQLATSDLNSFVFKLSPSSSEDISAIADAIKGESGGFF